MSKVFASRLFPVHQGPGLQRLPGLEPQPCHVLRHNGDSGKAMISPFVDEQHQPVSLAAAAGKISNSPCDAAATVSSLERKDTEHTGAVDAAITGVNECNGRYCRPRFPRLLTLTPVGLEKGTCVRIATGGEHRGNLGADWSPIWNKRHEVFLPRDHVSDKTLENSLLLPPAVFSSRNSPAPALVVPDGYNGVSLNGHAVLGEGTLRNENTHDPMVSPLSSDDCVPPGASMPGVMSGASRFSSPDTLEPALVPDGYKGASLTGHAALGEGTLLNESTRSPSVSLLSRDDCVPLAASVPSTMSGTIRCSAIQGLLGHACARREAKM